MLHRPAPKKTAPKGVALVLPEHLRVAKDPRETTKPEPEAEANEAPTAQERVDSD